MENSKAILVVEDSEHDRLLMQRALAKSNLSNPVEFASDGEEALLYLLGDENHEPRPLPVLVLLDLKLPKISGLEVLEQIRKNERTRMLRVVILTSSVEQEDKLRGYSGGANSYIRKPVDFQEFVTVVQEVGLYWLVYDESPE